jgi:hypothetical protein
VRGHIQGQLLPARAFDLRRLARAEQHEAEIWRELTHVRRQVSRQAYDELAARLPALKRGPA